MYEEQVYDERYDETRAADCLVDLVELPDPDRDREISLPFSRQLNLNTERGRFTITSDEGCVELQVRITPKGPVLMFQQSHIEMSLCGNLDIRCHELNIETQTGMRIENGGDFKHQIAGHYDIDARDDAGIKAQSVQVHAQLGELGLKANDDIAMNGLRILMNVPSEEELVEKLKSVSSFQDFLNLPFVEKAGPGRMPKSPPVERENWNR